MILRGHDQEHDGEGDVPLVTFLVRGKRSRAVRVLHQFVLQEVGDLQVPLLGVDFSAGEVDVPYTVAEGDRSGHGGEVNWIMANQKF